MGVRTIYQLADFAKSKEKSNFAFMQNASFRLYDARTTILKDPRTYIEQTRDIRWGLNLRASKIYFCERDFVKRKIVYNANLLLTEIYRENHNL